MTTRYQKDSEKAYASIIAHALATPWQITNAPNELHWPDLLIKHSEEYFGLEVSEIYPEQLIIDSQALYTSQELSAQLDEIKQTYQTKVNRPLRVNFVGEISDSEAIITALQTSAITLNDFEQQHLVLPPNTHLFISALPIHADNHERWLYIADNITAIPELSKDKLIEKINEKSAKLPRYSKNINDVRLLLVCNALFKLPNRYPQMLNNLSAQGFSKIYLLSFPAHVDIIDNK